jgi:hypothetical protein
VSVSGSGIVIVPGPAVTLLLLLCCGMMVLVRQGQEAVLQVSAFVAAPSSTQAGTFSLPLLQRRRRNVSSSVSLLSLSLVDFMPAAPQSPQAKTKTNPKAKETAKALLEAIQNKDGGDSDSDYESEQLTISELALQLVDQGPHSYDPAESLFGPLWCTVAAFTPHQPLTAKKPLWERISLKQDNVKGQQYSVAASKDNGDDDGDDDETSNTRIAGTVMNYAEIFGKAFHLKAQGTFVPFVQLEGQQQQQPNNNNGKDNIIIEGNFVERLFGTNNNNRSNKSTRRRPCPDDYRVTVNKASFCVSFGDNTRPFNFSLDLPIQGSSILRVLYASNTTHLRIFVSPEDTKSTGVIGAGAGEWENAGLVVVQVRSDVIATNNNGQAIDLT